MFTAKKRLAVRSSNQGKLKLLASSTFNSMSMPSMSISNPGNGNMHDTLLEGILPTGDMKLINQFFRDIYAYDAIAGSAVDLMSTLPFSDWSLSGGSEEQLAAYNSATDMLGFKTILPHLSIDYLTLGKFVGTILYRRETKTFTDLICHNIDDLEITPTPLYNADPLITLKVPKHYRDFANSQNPYMQRVRSRVSDSMVAALKGNRLSLDSLTTLYVPRKTYSNSLGVSFYRRVLPIYLLERILYRGTLTEAGRRQRSTLHIMAGSEDWEPTEEELTNLVALFQQADLDPVGAIVATRSDVATADIRPGGDFWKYTDTVDVTGNLKLKALGISEGFLSGEVNFSTAEVALSVFIEYIRAYRDMITRRVFYDKIFPLVAVVNGFYRTEAEQVTSGSNKAKESMERKMLDTTQLAIPQVHWHKQLRPQADQEYLNILATMEEKGVPVMLRAWAAAGGTNMDTIFEGIDEDLEDRKRLAAYKKLRDSVGKEGPKGSDEPDESDGEGYFTASSVLSSQGLKKPIGLLQRDFGELAEIKGQTKTGKAKYIPNQKAANQKANAEIAKALVNLSDPHHYNEVMVKANSRLGRNPYGKV